MPETNIGAAVNSDLTNAMTDYSVDPQSTDAAQDVKETTWQMTNWTKYLGYYKQIPEYKTAVDTKARWTIGAGFTADEPTTMLLGNIKGNGTDSFNSILENNIKVYSIAGDAFCEVMRDDGVLVNIKPLDPSKVVVIANRAGQIIRYEQTNKNKKPNKKFKPEEIFHLSRDRIADEIHGTGATESVEWIILARNEAMNDWKTVLHRNVSPLQIHYLDTDDSSRIAAYKSKADAARGNGENMYVPKGTVEIEVVQSQLNQATSPLQWIDKLNDYFFQAVNVPQIIIGNAKEFTDASGKIVYLAYEQTVKREQLYIEEQVLKQLNLGIELTLPASLQNDAVSDSNQEVGIETQEPAAQPNDTTSEMEGKQ